MKQIVLAVMLVSLPMMVHAHPLVDLLLGSVIIISGGAINMEKNNLAGEKQEARNRANNHETRQHTALQNEAIWSDRANTLANKRRYYTGYNRNYDQEVVDLMNKAREFEAEAIREELSARRFNDEAGEKANRENLFKGITVGAWTGGGMFLAKSLFCFLKQRRADSLVSVEPEPKNYEFALVPVRHLDGAMVTYRLKW